MFFKKVFKQKFFIDFHKGITFLYILLLMQIFDIWNNFTIWIYLSLHGTYGIMWILKSRFFPDKNWEKKCSLAYGIYIWMGLSLYWITPFLILSGIFNNGLAIEVPKWYLSFCISLNILGVFFHFTSDMQKYCHLKLNPGNLINDGMIRKCRNLNYFGELLIYLGFGLLAMHWVPVLVLGLFLAIIWIPNMIKKDKSLARYPDFISYKKNSKLFIPFIW